jgi:hypothetical protein
MADASKSTASALGSIYRHGDAMLNSPQLQWLVTELSSLDHAGMGQDELLMRDLLLDAANEAIRMGGYLYFDGD